MKREMRAGLLFRRPLREGVIAAAFGDFGADGLDGAAEFAEEVVSGGDFDEAGMACPGEGDIGVDGGGLVCGLDAKGVGVAVALPVVGNAEMDHGGVTREFGGTGESEIAPEVGGIARPVGQTVEGAAIAEDDGRIAVLERTAFQFDLHADDRALGGLSRGNPFAAGKAAAEQDAGGFGEDLHVFAEVPADDLEHGGLARARAAREDDEAGGVRRGAAAAGSAVAVREGGVGRLGRHAGMMAQTWGREKPGFGAPRAPRGANWPGSGQTHATTFNRPGGAK